MIRKSVAGLRIGRNGLGVAAAVVMAVGLAACSEGYKEKEEQQVSVTVQSALRSPVSGVTVTPWILDVDVAGDSRAPIQLDPQVTDQDGRAEWLYTAFSTPAICGIEVKASNGTVLFQDPPSAVEWISVVPGQMTVTLEN
jgi:hypothetical protein